MIPSAPPPFKLLLRPLRYLANFAKIWMPDLVSLCFTDRNTGEMNTLNFKLDEFFKYRMPICDHFSAQVMRLFYVPSCCILGIDEYCNRDLTPVCIIISRGLVPGPY